LQIRRRHGALRHSIGAGASYGAAKSAGRRTLAESRNSLQSEADADVSFWNFRRASVSTAISSENAPPSPIDLTGKTAMALCPAIAIAVPCLFIGNDSGSEHVAAAVGLPIVAVFGPTDPSGTSPVTTALRINSAKALRSPVQTVAVLPIIGCMTRNHGRHGGAAAKPGCTRSRCSVSTPTSAPPRRFPRSRRRPPSPRKWLLESRSRFVVSFAPAAFGRLNEAGFACQRRSLPINPVLAAGTPGKSLYRP